ncbi:MAG: acid phosphatase pho5 [Sclerophora amabilis]|nr:MAG: acid phosphatase pho5 [Sclerophora amabilis]
MHGLLYTSAVLSCAIRAFAFKDTNQSEALGKLDARLNARDDWNILHHLGGTGPYVRLPLGGAFAVGDPPEGCKIEQVHMDVLSKIKEKVDDLDSLPLGLEFISRWADLEDQYKIAKLIRGDGEYAATNTIPLWGELLKDKYSHLVRPRTKMWYSARRKRVQETAELFATAFRGRSLSKEFDIVKDPQDGANTLGPIETCRKWKTDSSDTRRIHEEFSKQYGKRIRERLQGTYAKFPWSDFSSLEIQLLQRLCPLRIMTTGSINNDWCDLFTREEWESYEYARDLNHYYKIGPGNPKSINLGFPWIKSTTELLRSEPSKGTLFFSFSQDSLLIPVVGALNLFSQPGHLPPDGPPRDWNFRSSRLFPMGARLVIERLNCEGVLYVRIYLNEGYVSVPGCDETPGRGCPMQKFVDHVEDIGRAAGNWNVKCGTQDEPEEMEFLYKTYSDFDESESASASEEATSDGS